VGGLFDVGDGWGRGRCIHPRTYALCIMLQWHLINDDETHGPLLRVLLGSQLIRVDATKKRQRQASHGCTRVSTRLPSI
jgi:hypothetical protein